MPEICSFADPDWAIEFGRDSQTAQQQGDQADWPRNAQDGLASRDFRGYSSTLSRTIVKELITPAAFLPGAEVIVSLLPTISNVLF